MDNRHADLIQQIAIDVAVIKNELSLLKGMQTNVEQNHDDITRLKAQLSLVKWIGGIIGASVFGVIIKVFHMYSL